MNRIIKFRAVDLESKSFKFIYSDKNGLHDFFYGVSDGQLSEPEQFTGIIDRNGKEIYENDIVKCCTCWAFGYMRYENIIVKMWFDRFKGGWNVFSADPNGPEIIGNIHQNPELLK